jgi:PAS domain S-box-containing protein
MKKRSILLFLVVVIVFCSFLFGSFYNEARQDAIKYLNNEQLLHATDAARGIEDFFNYWTRMLTALSESTPIIDMDQTGKNNIQLLYNGNRDWIRGITRVDAEGWIVYTFPLNPAAIRKSISQQAHVQEIMRTHKPVVSDVFFAVQGYETVALHVPVFKNRIYRGTIAVTINFQSLAKRYLEDIKIGNTGYAWVTSREGIELYSPLPGHTGKSVWENSKDSPSILAMAKDMLKGNSGSAIYTDDKIHGDKADLRKRHAVFMPIKLGNTFWSVVVCSAEDEIIASLENFRNKLILVICLLLLVGVLFSYYGLKARFIIKEEEERRRAEEALRENEARLDLALRSAGMGVWSWDIIENKRYFDDQLCHLLGINPATFTGTAEEFFEAVDPDDRETIKAALARTIAQNVLYEPEYRVIWPEGSVHYITARGRLVRDDKGRPLRINGIIWDISERKKSEEQLQHTLDSLRKAVGATVQVVASAVESRDPYTAGHQIRSSNLARAIATEMGLSQEKIEGIRIAGSIHDIGKLSLPAEILSKPTKLSEIEFSLIKEHARQGYEILKGVESPWPLAEIVYQHHERMDGSGYPRNLKGEDILMEARILAVGDVVEAMAFHRPYRPGLGIDAALNEIEKNSGIVYDSAVADACLRLFREKGFQLEGA